MTLHDSDAQWIFYDFPGTSLFMAWLLEALSKKSEASSGRCPTGPAESLPGLPGRLAGLSVVPELRHGELGLWSLRRLGGGENLHPVDGCEPGWAGELGILPLG